MTPLAAKILTNPDNKKVLRLISISKSSSIKLQPSPALNGLDEGGTTFFNNFGRLLPGNTKLIINSRQNVLVNEETGQVFAFQLGRFSFPFRYSPAHVYLLQQTPRQAGNTLDGWIDISYLGPQWTLLNFFPDEEPEVLAQAYKFSKGLN